MVLRLTFVYLFIGISFLGCSQSEKSLSTFFEQWKSHDDLASASFGIMVTNKEGKVILEHNANRSLIPASTQKLLTTATALQELGPAYRFETGIWYTGALSDQGVLSGDLWVEGDGDPTLGSERFGGMESLGQQWIAVLKQAGITKIQGKVRVNTGKYPVFTTPRTWIWEDLGNYYGAVPSALSFHENSYTVQLSSPSQQGALCEVVKTAPNMQHLQFQSQVVTANSQRDNAYIFGGENSSRRYIKGSIPKGRGTFEIKGSIAQPDVVFSSWCTQYLHEQGLQVMSRSYEMPFDRMTAQQVHIHKSPPVFKIVELTNKHSINLYAEHLVLEMSSKRGATLSIESAAEELKVSLTKMGVDTKGMFLTDGSGLSRFNAVTPKQLVDVLTYMKASSNADVFESSLSIAGETGTLRGMFRNSSAAGKIKAKSGYMERVRSYAGYIDASNGNTYTFAILVNNYEGSASNMKYHIKKLLEKLSE